MGEALWIRTPTERWTAPKASLGRLARSPTLRRLLRCGLPSLGGCSIHPLQQEATGLKTTDLVNYIRCETRLAIQEKAINLLNEENEARATDLGARLKAGLGATWPAAIRATLTPSEQGFYDRYVQTGIAFDFSFDITEEDIGSGFADPVRLITNGAAGVGLSAGGDYKRNNLRHFIVSDTFLDLLQNEKLKCGTEYRYSNYAYPISGTIGLAELIDTFVDLNELKPLAKDKATSSVFADTLTFTTTLTGSVSPHVIVAPVGNQWGLASSANVTASAQRIDKHAVIIGLSMDSPKGAPAKQAAAVAPGYQQGRSALQKSHVTSQAEQSALDAVSQARLDAYLDRVAH